MFTVAGKDLTNNGLAGNILFLAFNNPTHSMLDNTADYLETPLIRDLCQRVTNGKDCHMVRSDVDDQ